MRAIIAPGGQGAVAVRRRSRSGKRNSIGWLSALIVRFDRESSISSVAVKHRLVESDDLICHQRPSIALSVIGRSMPEPLAKLLVQEQSAHSIGASRSTPGGHVESGLPIPDEEN